MKNENNCFSYILKRVSAEGKFLTDIWIFFGNELNTALRCLKQLLSPYTYMHFILKNAPQIGGQIHSGPLRSATVNNVYLQDLPIL